MEKCSCTGKISLALPTEGDCCPDEPDCMTVKSMQLSDYMPTMTASLDLPVQPVLYEVFSLVAPSPTPLPAGKGRLTHCAETPPDEMAQTIAVLRV